MRMIHISARRITDSKGVIKIFPRINIGGRFQRRHPVHEVGNLQAVPVDAGAVRQMIGNAYGHFISWKNMNRRAGGGTVIAPRPDDNAIHKLPQNFLCCQFKKFSPVYNGIRQVLNSWCDYHKNILFPGLATVQYPLSYC